MSEEQSVHCRFCLCKGSQCEVRLYRVCECRHPALRYAHLQCFQQHQLDTGSTGCDICHADYSIAVLREEDNWRSGLYRRVAQNREEVYYRLSSLADLVIVAILYALVGRHVDKEQSTWWLQPVCQYLSFGLTLKLLYHVIRWVSLIRTITAS